MPDLQKLSTELPDNVQLIGLVLNDDTDEDIAKTKEICSKAGVTFTQVISKDTLQDEVGSKVHATPSTFFVNKEGKIVGDVVTGNNGNTDQIKEKMQEALNGQK